MKYMNIGCNIKCWECNKRCELKTILKISIYQPSTTNLVYKEIIEKLKAQAGLLILQEVNTKDLDEEIKILAVSFYVSRLKLIEELQN